MKINEQLRQDMLEFFRQIRTINSFSEEYPQYSVQDVKDMRQSLLRSKDIEEVWGQTQAKRYQTTRFGRMKIE